MIGRSNMKQETMTKRVRDRAVGKKMMSPRKKMDMGMSPGPDMGADSAAPMSPMAMKKGGMAKKNYGSTEDIMGTGKTKAAAKADYAKKMKSVGMEPKFSKGGMAKKPAMKKGGMMLIIGLGKKSPMKKGK
jgi:hypothetical protein